MAQVSDKVLLDELASALVPFADLLEEPDTVPTDEFGMVSLFVTPSDVKAAQEALGNLHARRAGGDRADRAAAAVVNEFSPLLGTVGDEDDDCTAVVADIIRRHYGG